jgi:CheY-like chemotaxis protein
MSRRRRTAGWHCIFQLLRVQINHTLPVSATNLSWWFAARLSQVPVVNICTKAKNPDFSPTSPHRVRWASLGRPLRVMFDWESRISPMSSIRILVVEDFAPFRQFIHSTLGERDDLQIVCEVADGLEAVEKVEELKPDLILLDIGLPTLNGIEVARQVSKLAPKSKIIFLTQESSADVVQEALSLGAWGYVVKTMAAIHLLAAVDAVHEGKQFVRGGLSGHNFTDAGARPPANY